MKKYIKYIVITALVITAIMLYSNYRKNKNKPEWRTEKVSTGAIREVVTATGSLNPYVLVEVGTEVSGKIEKLHKDFNDSVRRGELLAKLDTEILKTNLDGAKAEVNKAKTSVDEAKLDYDLLKELWQRNMSPEYDMKKAEFKYQQALQSLASSRLNLQRAEKNLDNAYITSPIDGIIVARNVDEGQTVAASLNSPTLFKIANNLDQMQITANVDEADIGKINIDMPVEFTVDAYPTQQFRGSVKQIRLNPNTDQNVVSYSVIIDAANPDRKLLPGMTTNVTIIIREKENVLRIPESATRFRPSKEIWAMFGLKWEDDMIANARKKAMESMQAAQPEKTADASGEKPVPAVNRQKPGQGTPNAKPAIPDSARAANTSRRSPAQPRQTPSVMGNPQAASSGRGRSGTRIGMAMVWVLKGNEPQIKMIRTGISDGAFVEVLADLGTDDLLVSGVIYKDAKQAASINPANPAMQGAPSMGRRF
ncbi:MAG: efflux RND transporter periplasmic adaptor subunit [Candidatus Cloacimonadaceae bacterium]|nr:efflux RND transporter periplasmic adaptor subunit [Candidatus Cloacimonadaceae bacterium]